MHKNVLCRAKHTYLIGCDEVLLLYSQISRTLKKTLRTKKQWKLTYIPDVLCCAKTPLSAAIGSFWCPVKYLELFFRKKLTWVLKNTVKINSYGRNTNLVVLKLHYLLRFNFWCSVKYQLYYFKSNFSDWF